MARDRLLFFVSLGILAILAAFVLRPQTTTLIRETVVEEADEVYEVMVARGNMRPGDRLTSDTYDWETIDEEAYHQRYVRREARSPRWLQEAVVSNEIQRGQWIQHGDLMWAEGTDVGPVVIAPDLNKRAIAMEVDEAEAIFQFLAPGHAVDVIFTWESDVGFRTSSVTLLEGVRILSTGSKAEGGFFGGGDSQPVVLLEMTPREAEVFTYAREVGDLTLSLYPGGSRDRAEVAAALGGQMRDYGCGMSPEEMKLVARLRESRSVDNFESLLFTHVTNSLFPGCDVSVVATKKGFILSGQVDDPQAAEKIREIFRTLMHEDTDEGSGDTSTPIVDLMEVVPQQVLLCVRVVEVAKTAREKLGINWNLLFSSSRVGSLTVGGTFPRPGATDPNYFINAQGLTHGSFTLSAIVDLLETKARAKVIAEPNLTTISGKTAHFFAGGEFPILVPQGFSSGFAGAATVEFKPFGVQLEFTPQVEVDGHITLHILPEVSSLDEAGAVEINGFSIPSIVTRRAETTVKLWPGQCYAIAGLLQHENDKRIDHLSGLDEIPVIGQLFKSKDFFEGRTELMIVVTPYLLETNENCEYEEVCNVQDRQCDEGYYPEQDPSHNEYRYNDESSDQTDSTQPSSRSVSQVDSREAEGRQQKHPVAAPSRKQWDFPDMQNATSERSQSQNQAARRRRHAAAIPRGREVRERLIADQERKKECECSSCERKRARARGERPKNRLVVEVNRGRGSHDGFAHPMFR